MLRYILASYAGWMDGADIDYRKWSQRLHTFADWGQGWFWNHRRLCTRTCIRNCSGSWWLCFNLCFCIIYRARYREWLSDSVIWSLKESPCICGSQRLPICSKLARLWCDSRLIVNISDFRVYPCLVMHLVVLRFLSVYRMSWRRWISPPWRVARTACGCCWELVPTRMLNPGWVSSCLDACIYIGVCTWLAFELHIHIIFTLVCACFPFGTYADINVLWMCLNSRFLQAHYLSGLVMYNLLFASLNKLLIRIRVGLIRGLGMNIIISSVPRSWETRRWLRPFSLVTLNAHSCSWMPESAWKPKTMCVLYFAIVSYGDFAEIVCDSGFTITFNLGRGVGWGRRLLSRFIDQCAHFVSHSRSLCVYIFDYYDFFRAYHAFTHLQSGETALMLAVRSGNLDCVRLLLDAGADKYTKCNVRFGSLPRYGYIFVQTLINSFRPGLVNLFMGTCPRPHPYRYQSISIYVCI